MTLDLDLVLVAADNTQDAAEAAEYAAAIADRYDADLHVLHVLDQRIIQGLEVGDIEADTVAERQRWITAHARAFLPDDTDTEISHSGALGFSSDRLGRTPGSVILDVSENLQADFLVVPRVEPEGSPDEVLGKSALHVLEYAPQPVLSI